MGRVGYIQLTRTFKEKEATKQFRAHVLTTDDLFKEINRSIYQAT